MTYVLTQHMSRGQPPRQLPRHGTCLSGPCGMSWCGGGLRLRNMGTPDVLGWSDQRWSTDDQLSSGKSQLHQLPKVFEQGLGEVGLCHGSSSLVCNCLKESAHVSIICFCSSHLLLGYAFASCYVHKWSIITTNDPYSPPDFASYDQFLSGTQCHPSPKSIFQTPKPKNFASTLGDGHPFPPWPGKEPLRCPRAGGRNSFMAHGETTKGKFQVLGWWWHMVAQ